MTRQIDDVVDDILQRLKGTANDDPATAAVAALQRAREAGAGGIRRQHLKQAQAHIARIDAGQAPGLVQRLQAEALALQGRGGDTQIAHLTPGELVIPKRLQTPELMAALREAAEAAGLDPAQFAVGRPENRINPRTGQAEFDEGDELEPSKIPGDSSQSVSNETQVPSAEGAVTPPQGQIENVTVTSSQPFQLTDILTAAKILEGEAGGLPIDQKRKVMQAMLSRVGTRTASGGAFPQTLRDVMLARTARNNFEFDALAHSRAGAAGGSSMNDADQRSWNESLGLAHDMIVDAMHNGVQYSDRFFHTAPAPGRSLDFFDSGYPEQSPYPYASSNSKDP